MPQTQALLNRFLQYVKIESTADDTSRSIPSTPGQLEVGKLLVQQLQAMGVANAAQDERGVVSGRLPSNQLPPEQAATIIFNAHVDTSPDASGQHVSPQVITYAGGDIELGQGVTITVDQTPELHDLIGKTLITTDGRTLLGGDDKAGVAIIMQLAEFLCEHPEYPRPNLTFLFTCDEEIGRGVSTLDVPSLQGTAGYTFDGGGAGVIDEATFSADLAVIEFHGVNIHPSIGKGRLVNSIRAIGYFLNLLPPELSPEETEGEEGFIHPYELVGTVAHAKISILLRDFDANHLREQEKMLSQAVQQTLQQFPSLRIEMHVRPQYRNMAEGLRKEPRAVDLAMKAHHALSLTPKLEKIRGGTDGSQFTALGLPTPNLSSGQHNLHCEREFACLEEMEQALEIGKQLVKLWSDQKRREEK